MLGIEILDASLVVSLILAFFGGVISFLSPCVLPVALPYLAYMGGVSVTDMQETTAARRRAFISAVFFVLGLSTVFLLLGAAASEIGRQILFYQHYFAIFAGVIVIVFGLHFIGIFRLRFLDREVRVDVGDKGGSSFGAYLLGLAFAFGWTPCLGPILGGILTIAAKEAEITKGVSLLAVYAAGLGLPFLLLAIFLPRLNRLMSWMKRHLQTVERVSGCFLLVIGVLLLTGQFTAISNWLLSAFPFLQNIG